MLRSVLTVGGWTMASRILGFARDMLIAALLGAGPVADAFFVALKLPNLFRRLFGEGAFNAAFVPAFAGLLTAEGRPAAQRFADEAFAVMAFWLGLLTIAGEVFMPQVMSVLAPGFVDDPPKFALAVTLSRITFPYLILICLAALISGVLNGLERFTAAAASYVLFNVISIGCMLWLTPYVPTVGHALSWGVTASGVLQLGLLLWAVRRAGMTIHLPRPRLTPQMRVLLRRMAPGLVGAGVTQLNLAIDVIIASLLPAGTVSVLYYADRVQQLPLGVIGTAVGTALLPLLSRQVRAGESTAAHATLNRAIEYALFLTLPAAVALAVAAWPIMSALFGRGAFAGESVLLSSQSLAAYAVGLPAFVLVKVLAPGFFCAWRHGDSGEDRRCGGGAESGDECGVHGAAAACRAGLGDQPCRDIQRGLPGGCTGAARAPGGGCAFAQPVSAHGGGRGCDGDGAVGGSERAVCRAAAWVWARVCVGVAGGGGSGGLCGCGPVVRCGRCPGCWADGGAAAGAGEAIGSARQCRSGRLMRMPRFGGMNQCGVVCRRF